jgi:hypothetical protein
MRHRPDRAETPAGEASSETVLPNAELDEELDVEFESLVEPGELSTEEAANDALADAAIAPDSELDEGEMAEESHELRGGKGSVRDIMTWKEAIGLIIDGNMQTRSRTPHTSHPQRGSRRGRGRHRGERS